MIAGTASQETIVVGVGDCRFGRKPDASLTTHALGSCIAVMAWDWKLKQGGLLHIMLPDSTIDPVRAAAKPWVYADTGMAAMLRELTMRGSAKNQLRWCIAGGAGMMADSAHFQIGKRNHLAIKKIFWRLGLFIEREDVGGSESRSVRLDLETGRISMRKGTSPSQILLEAAMS
ncbi:MAG TPA: chemotaxis protein CheD [Bryobacteraceae bacterium]|jgi:chemotaxis protein CheD|nr:chemotaxis protein CheD [Bryobacteraceae bacterium]